MSTKNRNVVISFFTTNVIYLNKGQKLKLNTNFTVAVHTILCIAFFEKDNKVTSNFIAGSTGMNPVIIRRILGKLQSAGIVETKAGVGGSEFNFHSNPSPKCPVGSRIHKVLEEPLSEVQKALEDELSKTSVKDLLEKI